ncbi:hypothetical protein AeNC1_006737 [Aphanomyces euteiches]|nr:hypothetical protein AeNC1_006737 [Aphanomyces euteiches]
MESKPMTNTAAADAPPNETLYVRNLDDKIKEPRMKESLYGLFSAHGKVLQVLLMKAHRLRGQAWVTFEDIASASTALRALDGTMHFGKAMNVQFAKEKNDLIRMQEPNAKPREKRKWDQLKAATKPKKTDKPAPAKVQHHQTQTVVLPHKILFLQDVPEACNQEALSILFKQYHGFKEVRMVPGKKGLAFVEFLDEVQASIALQGLNGFKLSADERLKGRPRNESFNLHGAWAIHRVDNWLELLGIQLAFTTTNLIVFAADFYLTHQGLHGFLAKKPILSSVLSAGTERRKCVLLVSVLNCAHYINVGCPHWITSLPLDTTHSIKIGIQLYVKPRVQVILGYASMVEKKSPSRQRFESIDKPQPARKHVYVVSEYALIAVWALQRRLRVVGTPTVWPVDTKERVPSDRCCFFRLHLVPA